MSEKPGQLKKHGLKVKMSGLDSNDARPTVPAFMIICCFLMYAIVNVTPKATVSHMIYQFECLSSTAYFAHC